MIASAQSTLELLRPFGSVVDEAEEAAVEAERLADALEDDEARDHASGAASSDQRPAHHRRRLVRVLVDVVVLRLAEEGEHVRRASCTAP